VGTSKRIPHAVFPKQVGKWKISKKALHLLEFALLASVGDPNDFFRIRIRILKTKNEKDVLNVVTNLVVLSNPSMSLTRRESKFSMNKFSSLELR
jgi:hypothetical protein